MFQQICRASKYGLLARNSLAATTLPRCALARSPNKSLETTRSIRRHVGVQRKPPSPRLVYCHRLFLLSACFVRQAKVPGVLLLHGIPGTEQNHDVAYALRDEGVAVLLFHYRGCWGSSGSYAIHNLEAPRPPHPAA
jgi:predicted alpha/beta-fold hydrolase